MAARAVSCFFFFNDTATTEIYTLSLHDALPIFHAARPGRVQAGGGDRLQGHRRRGPAVPRLARRAGGFERSQDRKSTRLNSSHANISYAVFCLKKKKNTHVVYQHHTMNPTFFMT